MAFPTKKRKKRRKTIGVILMLMAFCVSSFCVRAEGANNKDSGGINLTTEVSELYRIEQVRAVAPYIRAFFYPDDSFGTNVQINGYLDGRELTLVGTNSWMNMGMGVDYYFVIDDSETIDELSFERLKQDLTQIPSFMGSKDTLSVFVVGDYAKKKAEKLSSSKSAELQQVMDSILQDGKSDAVYSVINEIIVDIAAENVTKVYEETTNIEDGLGLGRNRSVIVLVSDGIYEQTGGYGKEEIISRLNDNNIPLYFIQQKMRDENGNIERDDIHDVVRQSGGEYLIMDSESADSSIKNVVSRVNSCMVATFMSDNNRVSEEAVTFNMSYGITGNVNDLKTFDKKGIIIDSHMKDSSKPTVEKVDMSNDHTIRVEYSENISEESKNVRFYEISDERGNKMKPTGADYSVDGKNVLILTTPAKLYNGRYRLNILSGVTDDTEEKNGLEEVSRSITFLGGEDYNIKEDNPLIRYKWVILGGSVLLVSIIVISILINSVRKRMRVG